MPSFSNINRHFSQKFKFSGTGEGAGDSVRAMIESVSGRNYNFGQIQPSGQPQPALTRGPSGSSLGTPITDIDENELDWKKYGSNHSLSRDVILKIHLTNKFSVFPKVSHVFEIIF